MANQRTLLTFFNTSLALIVTGLTLIKFFRGDIAHWIGWAFLPAAIFLLFYGIRNYWTHQRMMADAYKKP